MKKRNSLTSTSTQQTEVPAEVIKLGIDIHKKKYVVVRQFDNLAPQSPQRFGPAEFLAWVEKQRSKAGKGSGGGQSNNS